MPISIYLVLDLIVLAALLFFVIRGARRGLVLSLCGLVAVIVAFVGAGFAARALSPVVADALEPRFASAIESRLDEAIRNSNSPTPSAGADTAENMPLSGVLDVLKDMGFYEELIDTIHTAVENGMTEAAASAAAKVAAAVAQSAAYLILFLAAFVLILLLWRLISHALDLVTRLPGLHFLNRTAGALFGLGQGYIFVFILIQLLQFFGHLVPEETVAQTHLLCFLLSVSPLSLLSGF